MSSVAHVLIVDDEPSIRDVLTEIMAGLGFTANGAMNGKSALALLTHEIPDLILLDMVLPDMNGEAMLDAFRSDESLRHIPVVILSGMDDMGRITRCLEKGAEDYVLKPFNPALLRARVTGCIERKRARDEEKALQAQFKAYSEQLEARVHEQVNEITSAQLAMIFALSKLAESRDPETGEHLERMREYCRVLCEQLRSFEAFADIIDDEFIANLYSASPLHDIGKVGVPDRILLKPGKLTPEEFDVIKRHTILGAETLRAVESQFPGIPIVRIGIEMAECHHERWDGRGYPHGVSGEAIPLSARILAVGDVYDALTSKRCYKEAVSHTDSASIIKKEGGAQFDPVVVAAFQAAEEQFITIRSSYQDSEKDFPMA